MKLLLMTIALLLPISSVTARPTSAFWTPCTTDTVAEKTLHVNANGYCHLSHDKHAPCTLDLGLEIGALSWNNINTELGVDYWNSRSDHVYFNGKVAVPEGVLCFDNAPSLSVGFFNAATMHRKNQTVVDIVAGKALPRDGGRAFIGLFQGGHGFGKNRGGVMLAYEKKFYPVKDAQDKEFDRWKLVADFATGKNAIGGGGVGITYYFTPVISLNAGPVWFTDRRKNGHWKLAIQFDMDIV